MAIKPIIFNTQMVEAILDGRKTQTRRIIKPETPEAITKMMYMNLGIELEKYKSELIRVDSKHSIGDILWVRETWQYNDDLKDPFIYKQKHAEEYLPVFHHTLKWKPSIHMPFDAARIFLKVTGVRAEKLHDISEKDAISEGISNHVDEDGIHQFYIYPVKEKKFSRTALGIALLCNSFISKGIFGLEEPAKYSFHSLWESINGMKSWDLNPWVWVYEFELLKPIFGTCLMCGCTDLNCFQGIKKTGEPCYWVNIIPAKHAICSACKPLKKSS